MSTTATICPPDTEASTELRALRSYMDDLEALGGVGSLLGWDHQVMMPASAGAWRARQMGVFSQLIHERSTSTELDRLISAVEDADPTNVEARVARRSYRISTQLPSDHVRKASEATALAQDAWQHARAKDAFADFAPHLTTVLELMQERAELIGYETERYDALHDLYEEGSRAANVERVFAELREPVRQLVDAQPSPDTSILKRSYPIKAQEEAGRRIIAMMGFDLDAGRVDPTAHPFCTSIGRGDVRLTTRYDEHWLPGSLHSTIHEAGHGIYEQAFSRLGLPSTLADAPGLGMHESQSRMFENIIGRGLPFWTFAFPVLQELFPAALKDVSVADFVAQLNTSERSLIRVEADELTYNMHVAARFELERAMVNGTLAVADLPEAWSDAYDRWVGVRPHNDADGCLQDVHWSTGSFGYFPTYTLGNVYSAQFVACMRDDIPDLDQQVGSGNMMVVRDWFDEHVYRFGSSRTGSESVEQITGGPVSAQPLIAYLQERFAR